MLVRWALQRTRARFTGTTALAVLDAAKADGVTPGYDIGNPRHPQSTHDQGASVDLAYFNSLAAPYNDARAICDAAGGSNDGFYCTAAASTQHVVDLPRQTYFLAQLFGSARVRVVGVDPVIAPLLVNEADRQLALGWISQAERDAFTTHLASGNGWPFMFRSLHVALRWW